MSVWTRRAVWTIVVLLLVSVWPEVSSGAMMARLVVRGVGLQTPESVLYDARADVYLVSNINGAPTGADGNGFITRLSPTGRVIALKWIDGRRAGVRLNAPKGMAIAGDTLYVADITAVRMFDRRTGRPKGSVTIPGATFMNDAAAAPDGSVYVTDSGLKPDFSPSGTDAVYRISRNGALTVVAKGPQLGSPNGATVLPNGRVLVVSYSATGEYYTLGPGGVKQNVRRLPKGGLDGVEALSGGVLLISSWAASAVYRVDGMGTVKVAVANVPSPADIGYDRRRGRVLIPLFQGNQVVIQSVR